MSFDVVAFIKQNPLSRLSAPYQSRLINKIKHSFTEEEQRLFVASFYCYLKYRSTEFVVSLDDVWEWLGFSTKGHAKRMLQKLDEELDYKILLTRAGKQDESNVHGGHNKEEIVMTIDGFKRFCMKAKTQKADEIHAYYIKLERILQEVLDEESSELRQQLAESEQMRINTENALKAEKEKFAKSQKKKCHDQQPGEVVYIYKNSPMGNDETLFKIGKTTNIMRRENDYIGSNIKGEMVHVRRCLNSELLEKTCHHLLDKYRVLNNREWFDVPFEVARNVVDAAQLFLDSFINDIDKVDLLTTFQSLKPTDEPITFPHRPNMYEVLQQRQQQEREEALSRVDVSGMTAEDPLNFDKFVQDCCETGDDSFVSLKADLHGAHKLWSRNAELTTRRSLFSFLEKRFKAGKKHFDEFNSTLAVYYGIKLKSLTFEPTDPNNPTEFEQYIMSNCKVGYTFRVPFRAIFEDFHKWKDAQSPGYILDLKTKDAIREYLSTHFYPKGVYLSGNLREIDGGKTNGFGVWGITLREDNSNTGIKICTKLRKQVVQINVTTKQIVATYDSVMDTAKAIGVTPSFISTDIRFKRVRDNHRFMLLKDFEAQQAT